MLDGRQAPAGCHVFSVRPVLSVSLLPRGTRSIGALDSQIKAEASNSTRPVLPFTVVVAVLDA